ncbi:MAG: ATP-binding protein [Proteobacteria bacterium]|nr:ATP-binding protein [Pseudomonadota bacterium]
MLLADTINISRQFLRSIRVDLDWGNKAALRGFVCQTTMRHVIESICNQFTATQQAAFTLTGPFGGGKSSLALVFASLLGAEPNVRSLAADVLGESVVTRVQDTFSLDFDNEPWAVIPITGRRSDPIEDITDAIRNSGIPYVGRRLGEAPDGRRVIKTLVDIAEARPSNGVLVIIDELGKFLEFSAAHDNDIHFFQELAEAASRCKGKLLLVGILHQAFEQYATRLGKEARDEWAKIQGRFVDIPLVAAVDEVLELTSRAIDDAGNPHSYSRPWCEVVARTIRNNRPAAPLDLAQRLDRCWPLHPVTAALLGAVSKRCFGQNERSTFGFLASAEPRGFVNFLRTTKEDSREVYEPAHYWDYLHENLEGTILASPEGHRWAQSVDAIERCQAKGSLLHLRLIKSIALIDLFRNGSGLVADDAILTTCAPDVPNTEIEKALLDMAGWSQIVFRKHLNTWAIYQGSDFDIDAALSARLAMMPGLDIKRLSSLANLQPIIPKRHYQETGAFRWFGLNLVFLDDVHNSISNYDPSSGISGQFLLVMPAQGETYRELQKKCRMASKGTIHPIALGVSDNVESIWSLGREYLALEAIQNSSTELLGDSVARRELKARTISILGKLQDTLSCAVSNAVWYTNGKQRSFDNRFGPSVLASELADEAYNACPKIFSELVNRHSVSSNTQAALNTLVKAIVENPHEEALGFKGFPAERGLYATILKALGLHLQNEAGSWEFVKPSVGTHPDELVALWNTTNEMLQDSDRISLSKVLDRWGSAPFGLRKGVRGCLGLVYIITNLDCLAIYKNGVYQPEIDHEFAHEVLRDPGCIELQQVVRDEAYADLLYVFAMAIETVSGEQCAAEPLLIGRALVKLAFDLPSWTRRTTSLSKRVVNLRKILLHASDPHRLLFVDLPNLYGPENPNKIGKQLIEDLSVLHGAYPALAQRIIAKLLKALAADAQDFETLHARAKVVKGLSGDFRLECFASRLLEFDGTNAAIEGLMGLAVNLPPSEWTDATPDAAELALADMALKFRQAEMFAAIKERAPTRHAIGLVFGTGEHGKTVMRAIDIGQDEQKCVQALTSEIIKVGSHLSDDPRLFLAALAEAGSILLEQEEV